jgi:Tfp pilus assembly protein PilE
LIIFCRRSKLKNLALTTVQQELDKYIRDLNLNDENFRQYIQAEINRLASGYVPHSNPEGSGKHNQRSANKDDYFIAALFRSIAAGARARQMTIAAAHMEHYLGNSGSYLTFSGTKFYNDVPSVKEKTNLEKNTAIAMAKAKHNPNIDFSITGDPKPGYATRAEAQNWFYAVGGHTYKYVGNVKTKTRILDLTFQYTDTYTWDQAKTTQILEFTFPDKVLGRLHQAGIAREYPMGGSVTFASLPY